MGIFRYVPGTPLSRHHLAKLGQTPQEFDYPNENKTLVWSVTEIDTHNSHISQTG